MTQESYPIHPAAELFLLRTEEEFAGLKAENASDRSDGWGGNRSIEVTQYGNKTKAGTP